MDFNYIMMPLFFTILIPNIFLITFTFKDTKTKYKKSQTPHIFKAKIINKYIFTTFAPIKIYTLCLF